LIPDSFLLIPGVGAQGGSLEEVAVNGLNDVCGLLVNSSRGIIYASSGADFDQAAGRVAKELQEQMAFYLEQKGII
jgi:orotidine-5'-phosphate decarboxylase